MNDVKTAKSIKLECLNFNSASAPAESTNELLSYTELDLENILLQEFEQGLPSDIYCLV